MHHLKTPKITVLYDGPRQICRAHVWSRKGYSTKTFATHAEAQAWIEEQARRLD